MATTVLNNLRWGLKWGVAMAAGFTVIALALTGVDSLSRTPNPNPPPLADLVGIYVLAGIGGGLIVGLLRPITKYLAGAMIVGTAIAALWISLIAVRLVVTDGSWGMVDVVLIGIYSLTTGPLAGYIFWRRAQKRQPL